MADKELWKLKRKELLQMLLVQCQETERFKQEADEVKMQFEDLSERYERLIRKLNVKDERLNQKDAQIKELKNTIEEMKASRAIELEEAGSIAEAALRLNGVFEAAQRAAEQYLMNVKKLDASKVKKLEAVDKGEENRIPFETGWRAGIRRSGASSRSRQIMTSSGELMDKKQTELEIPSIELLKKELERVDARRDFRRALLNIAGVLTVVAAVAALVVTRIFVLIQVNGSSMSPTFKAGEIVFLYQTNDVKAGDTIGFYYGGNIFLKRIIGTSGDNIEIDQKGNVYVNDELPNEPYLRVKDETGYPASVTIAQIIQESGFGKYGPGGGEGKGLSYLAYQYCNLFGIKGKGTAVMNTLEMTASGETYQTKTGFRAYHTYTECIEDRSKLLEEVYSDLTENVTDANTFAMKIGRRWATDINYGKSLIRVMQRYDMYRLDDMTLVDFSKLIGRFANPCPGSVISSTFGYRTFDHSFHKGLDLGTGTENIPTYAAEAGIVTFAGEAGNVGNLIIIDHGDGLVTKYMHHEEIYVEKDQKVEKGQQIGLSGTTGDSTGNHLHFQVEENGTAVDPVKYL